MKLFNISKGSGFQILLQIKCLYGKVNPKYVISLDMGLD